MTAGAVADTVVVPYNVVPELDDDGRGRLSSSRSPRTWASSRRAPGSSQGLRDACDRVGALLLFDEVITGFRLGPGGATALFGVRPDLWCFGKVIGGGLPVGAFGASTEIMAHLAPLGGVYQAGTLSGNPLATAAGLGRARPARRRSVRAARSPPPRRLADGLADAFAAAGVAVSCPGSGRWSACSSATKRRPTTTRPERVGRARPVPAFFHGMLSRGIALAPGPYEVMFPSLAHSADDIAHTIEAAAEVAAEMAAADVLRRLTVITVRYDLGALPSRSRRLSPSWSRPTRGRAPLGPRPHAVRRRSRRVRQPHGLARLASRVARARGTISSSFAAEIAAIARRRRPDGHGRLVAVPRGLGHTFGSGAGSPTLHVIDSTDPDAVRRVLEADRPGADVPPCLVEVGLDARDPVALACVLGSVAGPVAVRCRHRPGLGPRRSRP